VGQNTQVQNGGRPEAHAGGVIGETRRALTLKFHHLAPAQKPNRAIGNSLARALTWLLSLVIVALSLVPPSLRPVTAAPHKLEHFAIFVMWGLAFGMWNRVNQGSQIVVAILFAGAIEIVQYWIPGRHSRISDFVVDAGAASVGALFGGIFAPRIVTWFTRRISTRSRGQNH
jgi:VanZ family protein